MKLIVGGFCCIGALIFLAGCQQEGRVKRAASGYDYKLYTDAAGKQPEVGDQVFFDMDICDDKGKVLQTYRNQKHKPSVKILASDNLTRRKNPIVDILAGLSVGDSVGIIIPRDSVPGLPPEYNDIKSLEYRLAVKEILSQEAFQNKLATERDSTEKVASTVRARLPEVQSLAEKTLAEYKSGKLQTQQTQNGVKYIIHEQGTGDMPVNDMMVTVHYYGVLVEDGKSFDASFNLGKPITFRLGRQEVIHGWDEVIPNLAVGTKASVFIPSNLGYGKRGFPPDIPADADLYFYMEIVETFY